MSAVARIIDANANRAREALRVLEEAARFILDDPTLAGSAKRLRHDLVAAVRDFGPTIHERDTPGDVGTGLGTASERTRATAADVVTAAGRRLGEALRAIEEYGKTIDAEAAARIERLRYEAYDLEQQLARAMGAGRAPQWAVCVLLTERLCRDGDWRGVARAAFDAGTDCIQLREKNLDDHELLRRASELVETAPPRVAVIVNDRPDIAVLAGAAGVHLGRDDLPAPAARRIVGAERLVGVSTHGTDQARQALRDGADYCGVGPMFPTTTKSIERLAGPAVLAEYLGWDRLPHLAIGGITPDNIAKLVAVGVCGVAASAAVCGADDPGEVVRRLRRAVESGRSHRLSGPREPVTG